VREQEHQRNRIFKFLKGSRNSNSSAEKNENVSYSAMVIKAINTLVTHSTMLTVLQNLHNAYTVCNKLWQRKGEEVIRKQNSILPNVATRT
jgi:hypothetical protein